MSKRPAQAARSAPATPRRHLLGGMGALATAPLWSTAEAATPWDEGYDAADLVAARSCALIPEETQGPYPLLSVVDDEAMVRRDITEGGAGVPLALTLKLVDAGNGCAPIEGAAVYLWHCDKDGVYSGYQQPGHDTRGDTFMRGVQLSNRKGIVRFTTVYPGWYTGRITHMHFQVYLAGTSAAVTATSQIAFPPEVTTTVYNSPLYAARGQNTSVVDFAHDNVFSDGTSLQLATVKGSVADGYRAKLLVGVQV